jgi:enoyl-CoA hydratase
VSEDAPPLRCERDGDLLLLVLSRPGRLNAVSRAMYAALVAALEDAGADRSVRAIVLTGEGRAFCSGADLKEHARGERPERERAEYIALGQRANRLLQEIPQPVVAAVNGAAVGAGLELALSADLIVVAVDARLRLPEIALGTFPGGGVTATLPARVGLARAKELILLGDFFTGEDAVRWGLANAAEPAAHVLERGVAIARRLAGLAPLPLARAKELMNRAPRLAMDEVMRLEAEALAECMATEDWGEGIAAFGERRRPRYRGR